MKHSAGIVLYRIRDGIMEVLLAHPGGPFWEKKDIGAWSIPKGLPEADEDPLTTAQREFIEETGFVASGPFIELKPVQQASGKIVTTFAAQGDFDPALSHSNTFTMEWPPKFTEIDRVAWFNVLDAVQKINPAQVNLLDQLEGAIFHAEDLAYQTPTHYLLKMVDSNNENS